MKKTPGKAGIWLNSEISKGKSLAVSVGLQTAAARSFLAAVDLFIWQAALFEDQSAAVAKGDFRGLPSVALVVAVLVRLLGLPGLVEPVQIRLVIGDPFLDGLPGRFDGFHGLDVEGWWRRAREMDNAFPEAVEAEEKLDFLATDDLAHRLHGAFAARALQRVSAPNFQDEVTPQGAHVAGLAFGRGGDEEDLGGRRFFGRRLGFG